jgi:hypothetical protein
MAHPATNFSRKYVMRIVQLTEAEAANSAVMENVSRYLLTGEPIADTLIKDSPLDKPTVREPLTPPTEAQLQTYVAGTIGVDAPDVGTEQPEVPVASPFAHLGFGTAAPSPATAPAGSAPSLPPGVTQERRAFVPPVPAVPEHQVNAPVAQTLSHAGLDLDKNGLFWDERIHSSSKDKNADGTWRKKRGVEKTLGAEGIAKVEAEIRAVLAIPGPAAVVPPVPAVPPVPSSVPAPPPAAVEPEPSGQAFMRWMEDLTPDMQPGGRFTPELMGKLLVAQGLPTEAGLMAFVQRPDLVPAARAMLDVWMADPSQVPQ